jgi:hypothetical protein
VYSDVTNRGSSGVLLTTNTRRKRAVVESVGALAAFIVFRANRADAGCPKKLVLRLLGNSPLLVLKRIIYRRVCWQT